MTQFVDVGVKHYCIKDKKRHVSSELKYRCRGCQLKCRTGPVIERLKMMGVV